jgi:D-cysteine desulfhydrase
MAHALPGRVPLAAAPTPIQALPRLGAALGLELSVKRDDLTGFAESGNKARKLEFLVHDALEQGADTLITVGALQSNCARATAVVAARLGLRCVLGLRGEAPAVSDGNLLLARLFGARAVFVPPEAVDSPEALFARLADEVRRDGGRPYVIPESGSNDLGTLGYAAAVEEIQAQIAAGQLAPPDAVVVAAWSGGTLAGLHLGKALFGLEAEIWGVPVQFDAETIRGSVWASVRKAAARIGADVHVEPRAVRLLDGYQGDGRAGVRPEELAAVARAARHGLLLDPVYTAKAFFALEDTARRQPGLLGRRVLFLHTGGGFGVFPFRAALAALADGGAGRAAGSVS